MVRISFDLDRPPVERFCQAARSRCRRASSPWRRKAVCPAAYLPRASNVRNDLLRRLDNAARKAGEGERSPHYLDEITAAERIVPILGLVRELAALQIPQIRACRRILQRFANSPFRSATGSCHASMQNYFCFPGWASFYLYPGKLPAVAERNASVLAASIIQFDRPTALCVSLALYFIDDKSSSSSSFPCFGSCIVAFKSSLCCGVRSLSCHCMLKISDFGRMNFSGSRWQR